MQCRLGLPMRILFLSIFNRYSLVAQLTLIESPLYALSNEPTLLLNPQREAPKRNTAVYLLKSHFAWSFFVWKLSATFIRHWPNYPCKMIGGGDTFYLKFWVKVTALEQNRQFSIAIFTRSASAVTLSEKSSVNTNRKSTTRFPLSPRWTL